jgi:dipeptidase D
MSTIKELKPSLVWGIFEEITRVPRPSKHEEKIIAYLVDFAKKYNLAHKVDAAGNVVIYKPATPGYENSPAVVLQSHSDMVCEKNADKQHDFMTDPIEAYIDGEWVKAKGTTLGADCGIGMAAALAVLVDDSLKHPAIEALFTVDEETGLTGAFNLAPDMLSGKYLLNLDSEDEGELFIGCAGGIDTLATFTYKSERAPKDYAWMRVEIGGLKGGHSGDNIPDGLGNSNKIMARLLQLAAERYGLRINDFNGGNLRNAIPREAFSVVGVPAKKRAAFLRLVKSFAADISAELQYTDAGFWMKASECDKPTRVIDLDTQDRLLTAIVSVANGVLAMSFAMKGLVETSTNLASVKFLPKNRIQVVTSQRSSVESAKRYAARTVEGTFRLAGAKVVHSDGYPGWAPNPKSHLLDVAVEKYRELFGKEPVVRAIHAGLECGLFLEKYPHLEMISFGPTLRGVHSPDERLEIATVEKFWRHLVALLASL